MVFENLSKTDDIVGEVGHGNCCFGSDDANTTDNQTAHRTFDEAEHVFHTAARSGFLAV